MSTPWPPVPLSELLTPVSRPERVDPMKSYRLLGARWYAEGLFVKDARLGSEIQASTLYRVEAGDFVYNRLFAWKGSFAIATDAEHGCHVSNEFPCFSIRSDRLDSRYLWRYFSRASVWDEALGLSTGGTPTSRNRLKEQRLLAMAIPLPPLHEQRRIVARIEEVAGKIEEARRLRQISLDEQTALISSLHVSLANTRVVRLADLLTLDETQERVQPDKEYPQVGVKAFGQGLFAKDSVSGSRTTYRVFNRLFAGAIVLSQVKGWEGAVAICPPELAGMVESQRVCKSSAV